MRKFRQQIAIALILLAPGALATAQEDPNLTIYDIQFSTAPDGASPYNGCLVNCRGGIVTYTFDRSVPRLALQDPCFLTGWGGIQVKDRYNTGLLAPFRPGDRLRLQRVRVEDYVGNTFLQLDPADSPQIILLSRDHPLPAPFPVPISEIAAPVYRRDDHTDGWIVADRRAEKYEGMILQIQDIAITQINLGKAADNYCLQDLAHPHDPNYSAWAADYLNPDKVFKYHPYVQVDRRFCRLRGLLEHYTRTITPNLLVWDYYQLLTTATVDFLPPAPADLDQNCTVDLHDLARFAVHWLETPCPQPDCCGGTDLVEPLGRVDLADLEEFIRFWLQTRE